MVRLVRFVLFRFDYLNNTRVKAINSVDRKKLNELLLNEASKNPNVELYFEHALEAADLDTGRLNFRNK